MWIGNGKKNRNKIFPQAVDNNQQTDLLGFVYFAQLPDKMSNKCTSWKNLIFDN